MITIDEEEDNKEGDEIEILTENPKALYSYTSGYAPPPPPPKKKPLEALEDYVGGGDRTTSGCRARDLKIKTMA